MKILFTKKMKHFLFICFLLCYFIPLKSQNSFDINSIETKNLQAQISEDPTVRNLFKEVDRYRQFDFNKQLSNLTSNNIGDTLSLVFFEDKQYQSVIQKVTTTLNGRTSITSKIEGTQFAYCYMVASDNTITIYADFPLEDESFFAAMKNGEAYISQVKKSDLAKTALLGTHEMINFSNESSRKQNLDKKSKNINDPVTIDLLVVYTPASELWALDNWMVTDIFDLIDIAIQLSNNSVGNSNTGITFNVVYIHKTNYVEANSVEDLYRITDPYDGYMDEVHVIRDEYFADEILFLPEVDFTGGVAWLLNDEDGFDPDYYAVALSRVQQTSWTYTAVHEIGHNMGAHHHWAQNFQPGPGLFSFSSGWKGISNGNKICTVMTYEGGYYFGETGDYTRIPYFSSPEITYNGVTIGDAIYEDNALTLKITKIAVSNYRSPSGAALNINPMALNFNDVTTGTTSSSKTINITGINLTEPIYYVKGGADANAFNITQTSWNPTTGGVLSVTFSPSAAKLYNATITFSNANTSTKVVTLSGKGTLPTYKIIASAGTGGNISPSGTVNVSQGGTQKFTFTPNTGYKVDKATIDGADTTIIGNSYTFNNIINNHTINVTFIALPEYTITVTANDINCGTVTGGGNYIEGKQATVVATPEVNCKFLNWTESGNEVSTNSNYTFTVDKDRILLANFIENVGIVSNNINNLIKVYPNPTNGELRIMNCSHIDKFSEENYELLIEEIEIYDVFGRKLDAIHIYPVNNEVFINIFHLQAGFYFIKIKTETGIVREKIIKQ